MSQPDITQRADIHRLIEHFYAAVRPDPLIGHLFTHVDWAHHLPRIQAFWEQMLLGTAHYTGHPMDVHIALHQRTPLNVLHFERWLGLFRAAVDELFAGPKAEEAKERATSIASVMRTKVVGR
jgi:hemoglobin